VLTGDDGDVTGIRFPATGAPAGPAGGPSALAGYLHVGVQARLGQPWAADQPVTADELAWLLCELGLAGRPVLLVNEAHTGASCPILAPYAAHLARLLGQPVLASDGTAPVPATGGTAASGPARR
jgi:hypothetical protein